MKILSVIFDSSIQSLKCLTYLEKLKELRLIDKTNQLTNPVCLNNSYNSDVKEILPGLITLDGFYLDIKKLV